MLLLCQAVLVMFALRYLNSDDTHDYQGPLLIVGFTSSILLSSLLNNYSGLKILLVIGRIKNTISLAIANKIVHIKMSALQGNNSGKIINVISSDMELLEVFITSLWIWITPLYYAGGIIILGLVMGPAGIIGLIISLMHLPFIMFVGRFIYRIKISLAQISDTRIKMITNLIEGIRIVKLYG